MATTNLKQLRYFCVLAETQNFGRAAQVLCISQPPLTRQIAALEADLGTKLFDRTPKGVSLTAPGRQLYEDAQDLLRLAEQATRNVKSASRGEKGELVVGFTMSAVFNVVPTLTALYTERFPDVALSVRETMPNVLKRELRDGAIDFAITYPELEERGISRLTIFREPMNVVLPRAHKLARSKRISLADLSDERFISVPREQAAYICDAVQTRCQIEGFVPRSTLEVHLHQTIVHFVAAGLGVGFLPASLQQARVVGAVFREIPDPPIVALDLAWSAANRNPCLGGFRELAISAFGGSA